MDNDRTDASAPNGKKRRFLKKITFSKIMKLAAVLIIILVYFLLFFRMYLAGDHGVMNSFSYTESTVNNAGSLRLMTQTLDKTITDNGFYSISNLVFEPSIGQLQINLRYNNSTLDVLNGYYPNRDKSQEPFVCSLSDADGKVASNYTYIKSSNLIYNFRKLIFDGIDFSSCGKLYLNVYYSMDIFSGAPMNASFLIYDPESESYESDIKIGSTEVSDDLYKVSSGI